MMNSIIPIAESDGQQTVSARDLYAFLGTSTEYRHWIKRMLEYGFEEGLDFRSNLTESSGGRPATEHTLTLDTAKEIAMLQRSPKGRQARRYFIEVEKQAKAMYKQLQAVEQKQLDREERMLQQQMEFQKTAMQVLTTMSQQQMEFQSEAIQLFKSIQSQLLASAPKAEPKAVPAMPKQPTLFATPINRAIKSREDVIDDRMGTNLQVYQQMYLPHYNDTIPDDAEKAMIYAQAAAALHIITELGKEYGYGDSFFRDVVIVLRRRCIFKLPSTTRYLRDRVISIVRGFKTVTDLVFVPRIGLQNARKY